MGDEPQHDPRRELGEIRDQMRALQQRLDALEARFSTTDVEPQDPPVEPRIPRGYLEDLKDRKMAAALRPPPLREEPAETERPAPPMPPPTSPTSPTPHTPAMPARPRRTWSELEWLIGAKGVMLAGVLILVIAAGLFLKEAWDRGWVDQVPGWMRCGLGAGFGAVLVVVGEFLRRKINDLASTGVSAAGLAIVFGSILAATRLYELMPMPVAFVLLALTSLFGVGLGSLSSRVLLAGLSLIGAFVVPLVVHSDAPSFVALPAYLLALLAMGLTLAGWKGSGFAPIRRIAWWGTAFLGTLWGVSMREHGVASPVVFASLVWAMTVAELVVSARFFTRLRPSHPWPENAQAGFLQREPGAAIELDLSALWKPEARWINSVFGATVWAVVLMVYVVHEHAPGLVWIVPAAMTIASLLVALACAPEGHRLWTRSSSARSALATALTIDAAALLALTIATGLGGAIEVITWAFVGLAAIVFGARMRFHAASVLGLLFIAFGLGRLVTFDLGGAIVELRTDSLESIGLLGLRFSAWSAQVFILTATLVAAALLLRRSPYRQVVAIAAVATGALAFIGPGSDALSIGAAWAVLAVALAYVSVAIRRADVGIASTALLVLGTLGVHIAAYLALAESRPPPAAVLVSWTEASWALLIVGATWIVASVLRGIPPVARMVGAAVAYVSLAAMLLGDGTPMATLLVGWVLLLAVVVGLAFVSVLRALFLRAWLLPQLASAIGLVLAATWISHRAVTNWGELAAPPLLHEAIASATLLVAALGALGWLAARAQHVKGVLWDQRIVNDNLRLATYTGAGVLSFAASSSEVVRAVEVLGIAGDAAPDAALSVWWAMFAVSTIALGVRIRIAGVRWTGLALLGLTAAKVLAIDMASLEGLTRIFGSTVVGLILLGAGVGYAWLMGRGGPTAVQTGPEAADRGTSDERSALDDP
ncbi:MAG: DUF2339 domain-containing protein [Phycisphaerales bacterium JB060]